MIPKKEYRAYIIGDRRYSFYKGIEDLFDKNQVKIVKDISFANVILLGTKSIYRESDRSLLREQEGRDIPIVDLKYFCAKNDMIPRSEVPLFELPDKSGVIFSEEDIRREIIRLTHCDPTWENWNALCAILDRLDSGNASYTSEQLEKMLESWPDNIRIAPQKWMLEGMLWGYPFLRLCRFPSIVDIYDCPKNVIRALSPSLIVSFFSRYFGQLSPFERLVITFEYLNEFNQDERWEWLPIKLSPPPEKRFNAVRIEITESEWPFYYLNTGSPPEIFTSLSFDLIPKKIFLSINDTWHNELLLSLKRMGDCQFLIKTLMVLVKEAFELNDHSYVYEVGRHICPWMSLPGLFLIFSTSHGDYMLLNYIND